MAPTVSLRNTKISDFFPKASAKQASRGMIVLSNRNDNLEGNTPPVSSKRKRVALPDAVPSSSSTTRVSSSPSKANLFVHSESDAEQDSVPPPQVMTKSYPNANSKPVSRVPSIRAAKAVKATEPTRPKKKRRRSPEIGAVIEVIGEVIDVIPSGPGHRTSNLVAVDICPSGSSAAEEIATSEADEREILNFPPIVPTWETGDNDVSSPPQNSINNHVSPIPQNSINNHVSTIPQNSVKPFSCPTFDPEVAAGHSSATTTLAVADRTQKIIADIKARAMATILTPDNDEGLKPQSTVLDFGTNESDDELEAFSRRMGLAPNNKSKSSTESSPLSLSNTAKSSASPEAPHPRRLGLRSHTTKSIPLPISISKISSPEPIPQSSSVLDRLLREKKRKAKSNPQGSELDEETRMKRLEETLQKLNDTNIERNGHTGGCRSPTPSSDSDAGEEFMETDDKIFERLLGTEHAKAVGQLLRDDSRDRAQEIKEPARWRLWVPREGKTDSAMNVDALIPRLTLSPHSHPILRALQQAARENDSSRLRALLSSGMLSVLDTNTTRQSLSNWLLELSICTDNLELSESAFFALQSIFALSDGTCSESHIDFNRIPSLLCSLGASADALRVLSWANAVEETAILVDNFRQLQSLSMLIAIATVVIRSNALEDVDIPKLFMTLLLLALEPLSSLSSKRGATTALEDIITLLPESSHGLETEMSICRTILASTASLQVADRRRLLSYLPGGGWRMRRLVRWVALGMILPEFFHNIDPDIYVKPLPLEPLLLLVTPPMPVGSPFRISKDTNYGDLLDSAEILNTALIDIESTPHSQEVFQRKNTLETLIEKIMAVNGAIVDTRAMHLDRTRAKDALQRICMRIHYQRRAPAAGGKLTQWMRNPVLSRAGKPQESNPF